MEPKVLVVEDDVEINELLGEYLALESMDYVAAFNGRTALDHAQELRPDALVLDVMLPDIDGYEVCRRVSGQRSTAATPIIMLTCLSQPGDRLKGVGAGAFRYLAKPFLPDDLIELIRAAVQWKEELPTRAPEGMFDLAGADPQGTLHAINEMVADIFARSNLPDAQVGQIRLAFQGLREAVLARGAAGQAGLPVHVRYRLLQDGALARGRADAIEWTLSEPGPGLIAEGIFTQNAKLGLTVDELGKKPLSGLPAAEQGHPWIKFLAGCGVSRVEKDTKAGTVRLFRSLEAGGAAVPLVAIDGARVPTRLRQEALEAKCRGAKCGNDPG